MEKIILPEFNEIPDVGLFLEQVQRFVSGYLKPLENITLTTSMISNYVKQGIISKPVRKQYFREQIADIMFVAAAKSVISLDNIKLVLSLQKEQFTPQAAYEYFRSELTDELENVFEPAHKDEDNCDSSEYRLLIRNICISIAQKVYLDALFEKMTPEIEE